MSDLRGGVRWPLLVVGGAFLMAVGLGVGYGLRPPSPLRGFGAAGPESQDPSPESQLPSPEPRVPTPDHQAPSPESQAPSPDLPASVAPAVVTLTPELMMRAGIKTSLVETGTGTAILRIPGVVQPNAYKEVAVTSLVSGRVTEVRGELGQHVMAGQALATVYSPEMADAQTAFIVARADQVAHGQRRTRTQRLAAIGAVSREELELLEAERAMHDAAVETARARLILLGIPEERAQRLATPQDVVTTIDVRAPLAGVITRRTANAGLNIDPATPLFTIVDLTTVWVIADLYERDFAKVRVGSPASITSGAYPDLTLRGRVSYIDPQVQPETRTAKLRVEVPNPSGLLRFGMYVDVRAGESVQTGVFVPTAAIQLVGGQAVAYVASSDHAGQFVERNVEVGAPSGNRVLVLAGLEPGERIVTEGVFFLRAETERLRANRQ